MEVLKSLSPQSTLTINPERDCVRVYLRSKEEFELARQYGCYIGEKEQLCKDGAMRKNFYVLVPTDTVLFNALK